MTGRLFALALALWLGAVARDAGDAWIDATVLPDLGVETSVEVLARDGRLLRAYTVADGRWRMAVDAVDPRFAAMLIAYEDKRFHSHSGVDIRAALRAVAQAVRHGQVVSGGSTLTMQVARLLEDSGTGQLAGKLRQVRLALALEQHLSKQQILQLYYLIAPYGGNLEGVRAASLAYFGKEPTRLTPAQSALLVALPQAPEARRPDRAPDTATLARDKVLTRLAAAGVIAPDQAQAARREAVPTLRKAFPALAPHLADRVVRAAPDTALHRTTIDAALQSRIESLAAEAVAAHGDRLQVAIVVADHRTAEVLASVGSAAYRADLRQGFVDMTRAYRSPGSTLKPLVYALAFDEGLAHPETLIEDRPMDFGGYAPQNFDKIFRGMVRVREALQLSLNLPVVALTDALGPAKLMSALRRAGVDARLRGKPGLAVALGGVGVTLEDMVGLYAMIARGGVARPLRVTGAGADGARVMSRVAAWQVADILSGMAPPVGAPVNRLAYKTGTSYGHRDAWAIGFDGAHVVGVWMGRADGTPVPGVFGGDLAAPVLFQAFARIKRDLTPLPSPPASALMVGNAALPQPLRQFRSRNAVFAAVDAPVVAFPPDGAEVELMEDGLLLRVQGGVGPFTWLVDGRPVVVAERSRASVVQVTGPGFVAVSVIDGTGQSAQAHVRLR
ncbi:penicillin-binding protein 1C [Pseudorhodobacter turbinis]|uniref:peptidoglycan glycosyltransferase n=1 Tax=Pseudorhodobacter turbinis TaxID=2500533 RepID=A0A4P8EFT1_9RHOB|nr:penicillin-binding protein 1C [Pseudorhodobacter turbinis]QCO55728.1 penicillin-binding protein 1C [Pseudorhodobacter turbinis]